MRATFVAGAFLFVGCGASGAAAGSDTDASSAGHGFGGSATGGAATAGAAAGGTTSAGGTTMATGGSGGAVAPSAGAPGGGSGGFGITAHDCGNLPTAGVWERISSPDALKESDAVVIDPFDPSIVWGGFADHGIYKSTDCGASWTHVNTGENAAQVDVGAPISMVVDPHNPGTIYTTAFGGNSGLWKTTNGGVDFRSLITPDGTVGQIVAYNLTNSVAMNPHDSSQLIVTMHDGCKAPYGQVCVAETKDAGETWTIKTVTPLASSGWASGAGVYILDSKTWIFASILGLFLTTDDGATWKDVTAPGGGTTTGGKTLALPFYPSSTTGHYYLTALEGLIESDDGKSWKLIPNSGRSVGLALGDGRVYTSDLWTTTYRTAMESDLTKWTVIPPPAGLASDTGSPYLAYDATQHILYSSNWYGGLWRVVTP